jgi:hypothetical protein
MSRRNTDLTQTIYDLLINKIEDYKDTVEENSVLFNELLELVKNKSSNRSLEVTNELISRVDDVLEDAVNTNVTCKLIIQSLKHTTPITLSTRDSERTERNAHWNRIIRENNLIPLLYLLYTENHPNHSN